MWKEKENDSMHEGAQEDEQFEMQIDKKETGGSEGNSAGENSEEHEECWKSGNHPKRVERGVRYSGTRTTCKGQRTQNAQSTRHSKIKFGRRGIGHKMKKV